MPLPELSMVVGLNHIVGCIIPTPPTEVVPA
jgi:hypothetical protein